MSKTKACVMPARGPYIVPPATQKACLGARFRAYWDQHNLVNDPDVTLYVFDTRTGIFTKYKAADHDDAPFDRYHDLTTEDTNVRDIGVPFPGGETPWVGIILE